MPQAALNHARPGSAWNWSESAMKRPTLVQRAALWQPSTAAVISTLVFLIAHEIAYHSTASAPEFPLTILADGRAILAISHGGLDALGVGLLIVSVLWLLEAARIHEGRPR